MLVTIFCFTDLAHTAPIPSDTDCRGEIDASDDPPVVELQQVPKEDEAQMSTNAVPSEPNIASTDSIEAAPTDNESIENEQSTVQQDNGIKPCQEAESNRGSKRTSS